MWRYSHLTAIFTAQLGSVLLLKVLFSKYYFFLLFFLWFPYLGKMFEMIFEKFGSLMSKISPTSSIDFFEERREVNFISVPITFVSSLQFVVFVVLIDPKMVSGVYGFAFIIFAFLVLILELWWMKIKLWYLKYKLKKPLK